MKTIDFQEAQIKKTLIDLISDIEDNEDEYSFVYLKDGAIFINGSVAHIACRSAARAIMPDAEITWPNLRDAIVEYFNAEVVDPDDKYLGWYFKFEVFKVKTML